MTKIFESGLVDASADQVWLALRDFSAVHNFASDIVSSAIENGFPADQIGSVRHMVFAGGEQTREQLVALSDLDRFYVYTLLPPHNLPIADYFGKIQVTAITDTDRALIEWSADFAASDGDPEKLKAGLTAVFRKGIEGMRAFVASS